MYFTNESLDKKTKEKQEKLGDAFVKGMTVELPLWVSDPIGNPLRSLFAAISFMYIRGLICNRETVMEIMGILTTVTYNESTLERVTTGISRAILGELLNRYGCKDMKELTLKMNIFTVPEWASQHGEELVLKICGGLFAREGMLYFLTEEMKFVRIGTMDIEAGELDVQRWMAVLGCGYDRLYGCSEKLHCVYLGISGQDEFYHCYDIKTDCFSVHKGLMLTVKNDIPYVYKDGYVAAITESGIKNIRKLEHYEAVYPQKDCFRIIPADSNDLIFYPYCVTFDGDDIPDDEEFCKDYIWMVMLGEDPTELLLRGNCKRHFRPSRFTVESILEDIWLPFSDYPCGTKKIELLEEILKALRGYVGEDTDIIHIMYSLCRANRKLSDDSFPSDKLCSAVKALLRDGEKSAVIHNAFKNGKYDIFEDLMAGAFEYKEPEDTEDGLIGFFDLDETEIRVTAFGTSRGSVLGKLILPDFNLQGHNGVVYYDCFEKRYHIVSNVPLIEPIRRQILKEFDISDKEYSFWVRSIPEGNSEVLLEERVIAISDVLQDNPISSSDEFFDEEELEAELLFRAFDDLFND